MGEQDNHAGNGQPAGEEGRRPLAEVVEVGQQPSLPMPSQVVGAARPCEKYTVSVCLDGEPHLPDEFVALVRQLEQKIGMPVFLIIQSGDDGRYDTLDEDCISAILQRRHELKEKQRVALLIDSPGGSAKCAYQIAAAFRRHCGGFVAVVPRYAKSAATLLSLGAERIVLGEFAELGPLDVQIIDPERERPMSALDEVQALERLHAFALDAADRSMFLMLSRSGKKVETLLPTMLSFVTEMMRPLLEKIDAVHYTQMSRSLKVAEEYAIRLLQPQYRSDDAKRIARHLVQNYPEHGFVIDGPEAASFGLRTEEPSPDLTSVFDSLLPFLDKFTAIGVVTEMK